MKKESIEKRMQNIRYIYDGIVNGDRNAMQVRNELRSYCSYECLMCRRCFLHEGSCMTKLPSPSPCIGYERTESYEFVQFDFVKCTDDVMLDDIKKLELIDELYLQKGFVTISLVQRSCKKNNVEAKRLLSIWENRHIG